MSKYIKPTISLMSLSATAGAASNCSTSTADANEVKDILISMGYDLDNAFGQYESCTEKVLFEEYCKFSSSIRIFTS